MREFIPTAAQDSEALRLAQEAYRRIAVSHGVTQSIAIIQQAVLEGMAWQKGGSLPIAEPSSDAWPNGCIKRSSCARHKACMYGLHNSCRYYGRVIAQEVEAAS